MKEKYLFRFVFLTFLLKENLLLLFFTFLYLKIARRISVNNESGWESVRLRPISHNVRNTQALPFKHFLMRNETRNQKWIKIKNFSFSYLPEYEFLDNTIQFITCFSMMIQIEIFFICCVMISNASFTDCRINDVKFFSLHFWFNLFRF